MNKEEQLIARTITPEEKADIEKLEQIGEGACAKLYRSNDKVLKILKNGAESLYFEGTLEKLANIKNSDLCIFPEQILKDSDGKYAGYTMEYVKGTKISEVFRNLSFEEIEKAIATAELGIEQLSEHKVIFNDMHFDNIMWDEKKQCMRIIDTDFFTIPDKMPPERANKTNLRQFNNEIETLIGIRAGALSNYLGKNQEYMKYYKERFKRELKGERLNSYELVSKVREVAEQDFGTKFNSLEEIVQKVKERLEEKENAEYEKQLQEEAERSMPFMKKVARRLASNSFFRKLPFVNKFIEKQLDLLPEESQQSKEDNLVKQKRESFMKQLSNNGKYRNLPPIQRMSDQQKLDQMQKNMQQNAKELDDVEKE